MIELALARFVAGTDYTKLPEEVVHSTKRNILDTLATTLAGSGAPGCIEVVDLVRELGGRQESTLIVYGDRVPSPSAALANSMMAHALDYDDTHDAAVVHGTASTVPAAFAIADVVKNPTADRIIPNVLDADCDIGAAVARAVGEAAQQVA